MEEKINGIVIRSVDYKENDKILTIYSLEKGKVTATIKGVKKSGAKLKFASELFCFAEFILANKNNRYTVINASYIDSFYDLRLNMKKYYLSSCVLEIINKSFDENESDENTFNVLLNTIKEICYMDNEKQAFIKFGIDVMKTLGYSLGDMVCYRCGGLISKRVFFHPAVGKFSCENCFTEEFREIKITTYNSYGKIKCGIDIDENDISTDDLIRFMVYYYQTKTEEKLLSGEALNKLLKKINP